MKKFYLGVLIFFMIVFVIVAVVMFISPVIPTSMALIFSAVVIFIEAICFKYLEELRK